MRNTMERIRIKPIVKTFRRGLRKPSIKITVSADIPELYHCTSNSPIRTPSPQNSVIKRIMTFGPSLDKQDDNDEAFITTTTTTRITVDDSVIDFPNCVDFGIKDFLCCTNEIDLELSSDTDNSFLEATPPHRFSDSELESQIEIMSITLDNVLNLGKKRTSFSKDDNFTFDLLRLENHSSGLVADIDEDDAGSHRRFQDENGMIRLSRGRQNGDTRNLNLTNTTMTTPNNGSSRRILPPPPRPFTRHISLPASIFMTYLMAEQNFKNKEKRSSLNNNDRDRNSQSAKNFHQKSNPQNERFMARKLTKIDGSYSSNEESLEAEENSLTMNYDENEGIRMDHNGGDSSSVASESGDSRREVEDDAPRLLISRNSTNCSDYHIHGQGPMISMNSEELDREDENDDDEERDEEEEEKAFTSEIERKSLVLRYMRKLVRQDTSGNFAPPDYCI